MFGPSTWLLTVMVVAFALVLGFALRSIPATASAPATLNGHDISWPQCSAKQGGYGLPLPPAGSQFAVMGLTMGRPFTENPCLAEQLAWARAHATPAQAYLVAAFPTAAQLKRYGGSGPWSTANRAGQLANEGYAQARHAAASLTRNGFSPTMVWVDVEPGTAPSWPEATAAAQQGNRDLLQGLMRGLQDAGHSYGLYSFTGGWKQITGSWQLPGVPVWATAGRVKHAAEVRAQCVQPSFSGGRVYLVQWYDAVRDYDITCAGYALRALPMPGLVLDTDTGSTQGDWNSDVVARLAGIHQPRRYPAPGTLAPATEPSVLAPSIR